MKVKEVSSETYGIVKYVEVAAVNMSKDQTHSIEFDPKYISLSIHAGEDENTKKMSERSDISENDKKDYKWFYYRIYSIPLEEFNKDWHIINKDFKAGDEYLDERKKKKECPIAVSNEVFLPWFVKIYPYLNDHWKENNPEYMKKMDDIILKNNRRMLEGFKNQDIKEIRSAVKLGADINFTENLKSPLIYSLEYQNINLFKYLANKSVKVPEDFILNEENSLFQEFTTHKFKIKKKLRI